MIVPETPPLRPADHPRVAVVYPTTFGEGGVYGGGERYAVELARALSRRVPARLVTFGEKPERRQEGSLEIRVHRPLSWVGGARNNPLSFGFLRDLLEADVIHCAAWNTLATDFAVLLARWAGKRVYVTDVGGGAAVSLVRRLDLTRRLDGILLIAEPGGAQFLGYRDRWSVIYAGIEIERYRPAEGTLRRGVLYVGRLLPHKGIDVLIEALDPGVPLHVVGRPYHTEYFELLKRLSAGKDVTFVTDATDDEVIGFYQRAAVAVLPSVNRTVYGAEFPLPELLGFTLMEAMSCGAAAICTRVGALPEVVVDGESGFVVPPSDPEALRGRLRQLLADPELAARLGRAARQRIVDRFTWDGVARRCLEAYAR
ncbi:MAG TPA: glycosyltransferase family 4 protein [Thermoanaerobaculia bacterium]|nr:glycosyltransferase family 4 protein [Thermoanaerobaculia bacterium]